MYSCLKSFYSNLLGDYVNGFLSGFETREIYLDESLYMLTRDSVVINPVKLYDLLGASETLGVRRRPIYGIMYNSRRLNRVLRLFSYKHNILSIDLTLLHGVGGVDDSVRYSDVIQLGRGKLEGFLDGKRVVKLDGVGGVEVVLGSSLPVFVVTDEDLVSALMGYMYVSRIILSFLGEWILFNKFDFLGGNGVEDLRITPVDKDLEYTVRHESLIGFLVECGGYKFLEYI